MTEIKPEQVAAIGNLRAELERVKADFEREKRERERAWDRSRCFRTRAEAAEAELERVKAERDEAQANYEWMVKRAADERLDGYRALGERAAKAEAERDVWKARALQLAAEGNTIKIAQHKPADFSADLDWLDEKLKP